MPSKRKRGGQPANRNALRTGTYSAHHPGPLRKYLYLQKSISMDNGSSPESSRAILSALAVLGNYHTLDASILSRKLLNSLSGNNDGIRRSIQKKEVLASFAGDPLSHIEQEFWDHGITRDADSFFSISEKSVQKSSLPPEHPTYPTNLTNAQWAVLSPLLPPDPSLDWLYGEPPVIIAASRFGFMRYFPTGELDDYCIMQRYWEAMQRYPALLGPPLRISQRKRGRPRRVISVRAILDAILWKLATGHTWVELPYLFPPARICRKYYSRLFFSGRLYTLLVALYNHFLLQGGSDTGLLWEQGVFTTTPSQHITLTPGVEPTWQTCTALLFMQLACAAWLHSLRRVARQDRVVCLPLLKGDAPLAFPPSSAPQLGLSLPEFEPLDQSPSCRELDQQAIFEREVQRRLRIQSRARPRYSPDRFKKTQSSDNPAD